MRKKLNNNSKRINLIFDFIFFSFIKVKIVFFFFLIYYNLKYRSLLLFFVILFFYGNRKFLFFQGPSLSFINFINRNVAKQASQYIQGEFRLKINGITLNVKIKENILL